MAPTLEVAALAVTAGCGFITGDEALAFSASPATVPDGVQSDTGYEETAVDAREMTREFTAAGQTREVRITNHLARYERGVDLGPLGSQQAAVFVAFASPEVEVATRTFNPMGDFSEREILEQFSTEYEGLTVEERVGNRSVRTLGQSTTVERFAGTATLAGADIDVDVHVTKVNHGGDFVVALGIHPQQLPGEGSRVDALLGGLEHGSE